MKEAPAEANRSIPELLRQLATETSVLVRQEISLARAEFLSTLKAASRPATAFGIAGLFGLGACGAATALVIAAIATALPVWASALVVTALYCVVAGVAVALGRAAMKGVNPVPKQTIKTIQDDIRTVRSAIERR
jgi:hypothetical protein